MKIVSQKIRDSAKGEDCAFRFPDICKGNSETVVFCHINTKFKGTGLKSPDLFGGYGCVDCHQALDSNVLKMIEVHGKWVLDGMVETQMKLVVKGLVCIK